MTIDLDEDELRECMSSVMSTLEEGLLKGTISPNSPVSAKLNKLASKLRAAWARTAFPEDHDSE